MDGLPSDRRLNLRVRPAKSLIVFVCLGLGPAANEPHELRPLIRRHAVGSTALSTRHRQLADDGIGRRKLQPQGLRWFDHITHTDPRGSRLAIRVDPVRIVAPLVAQLRIGEHLAEREDATVIIVTLVLPDRNAVARVKITPACKPPVLFQVANRIDYSIASRISRECPVAPVGRAGVSAATVLIGNHVCNLAAQHR